MLSKTRTEDLGFLIAESIPQHRAIRIRLECSKRDCVCRFCGKSVMPNSISEYFIGLAGRLQFRNAVLGKVIRYFGRKATDRGPRKIRFGEGAGLWFNAKSVNPGFLMGTSEPLEQRLLAHYLREGDVFYDIGANAGFYCVIGARRVGTIGVVYAFEPTPPLVERIEENAKLNDFTQIQTIRCAVSDQVGFVEFYLDGDLSVKNSLNSTDHRGSSIKVKATTIDAFTEEHRPPDLILMDIEGAELLALRGGLQAIRRYLPLIMIEVHWLGRAFTEFVEQEILPLGYVATTYEGDPLPDSEVRYHCLLRIPDKHPIFK